MDTYELLLDQITPFLESQFSSLPEDLKERISQAGMGKKTEETPDGVEEFEWAYIEVENKYLTDEEAKEIEEGDGIRKGKGTRPKVKTEHYYIWNTLSARKREYKVARYDFENYPGFREKATSSKLVETITPHLESNFSHLPQEIKMKIAYVDIFQKWDEISTKQRKYLAQDFDFRMHPDCDKYCNLGLEQQSIPNKILFWQGLNPHRIASEQIIIDTKIKELEEREVELEELLGYLNSNKEQELKQAESILVTQLTSVTRVNKLRRNILDPAIDEAIKKAGTTELVNVYLHLKELAKDEYPPFTGMFESDALCYTNENDIQAKLSKSALGKRLKRRQIPPNTVS